MEHVHDRLEARAPLRAGNARECLAHQRGGRFPERLLAAIDATLVERGADVTVAAAAEDLLLVAEVAEHEVVPARPRVHVPEQLPEERPRAGRDRRIGG